MNKDWIETTLGDLYDITSSKRVFESEWKKQGVPFYRAREIVKLAKYGFVENVLFISDEMYKQYAAKYGIPKEGDIMVTGVGTLGICYVVKKDDKFYFKDGNIIWLKTNNKANSKYVEYAFKSDYIRKQIDDSIGATVGTYTIIKAKGTKIPLPPLPEQQHIVAILDKAFEAIDKAKTNAEQNLKNAKELFDSYLEAVFEDGNWDEKTLGEICKVERGSSPRPIDKYFTDNPDGVNWIKIGDTKNVDKYIFTTRQKITKEGALQSRYVDVDDFILSNSMSFGKPYIMKTQGYIHDGWFVLRLPKNIDTEFFWYLLASPFTMNKFISLASGAIVKNISGDLVKKTVLPIPPLTEQKAIVKKLDTLSKEAKRLEEIYKKKIEDLEELKKSILQKAFSGEIKTI